MSKKINVLSLFNGMSFGMMALETCGIEVDKYYSSEIDKYANQATKALYPDIIQLGDVTKWDDWDIDLGEIDLLIAGFPCQAWSMAGKQEGDNDPRGALVHDLIAIWEEINITRELIGEQPVKFMFENVKMKKEFLDYINELFGVEPICINSALVSAQNRVRYYWTNIGQPKQPKNKNILLKDILENLPSCPVGLAVREKSKTIRVGGKNSPFNSKQEWDSPFKRVNKKAELKKNINKSACLTGGAKSGGNHSDMDILSFNPKTNGRQTYQQDRIYSVDHKSPALTSSLGGRFNLGVSEEVWRRYSIRECARLQTVPERHTDTLLSAGISNTQLYKMLGNGWTHDVIVHIFKGLHKWSNL